MTVITPHVPRDPQCTELDDFDELSIEQAEDLFWEDDYPELQDSDSQPFTMNHTTPRRSGVLTTRQR